EAGGEVQLAPGGRTTTSSWGVVEHDFGVFSVDLGTIPTTAQYRITIGDRRGARSAARDRPMMIAVAPPRRGRLDRARADPPPHGRGRSEIRGRGRGAWLRPDRDRPGNGKPLRSSRGRAERPRPNSRGTVRLFGYPQPQSSLKASAGQTCNHRDLSACHAGPVDHVPLYRRLVWNELSPGCSVSATGSVVVEGVLRGFVRDDRVVLLFDERRVAELVAQGRGTVHTGNNHPGWLAVDPRVDEPTFRELFHEAVGAAARTSLLAEF